MDVNSAESAAGGLSVKSRLEELEEVWRIQNVVLPVVASPVDTDVGIQTLGRCSQDGRVHSEMARAPQPVEVKMFATNDAEDTSVERR